MIEKIMKFPDEYPCPVCGNLCEVRLSKKFKPFFHCDGCVLQVFIRGKSGVNRFSAIKNNSKLLGKICSPGVSSTSNLLKLNSQIELFKAEIVKIENNDSLFNKNPNEERKQTLKSKLKELETVYFEELINLKNNLPKDRLGD